MKRFLLAGALSMLLMMGAPSAKDEPKFVTYSVRWVRFEDANGEQHYYWLDGKTPFDIAVPNHWPVVDLTPSDGMTDEPIR